MVIRRQEFNLEPLQQSQNYRNLDQKVQNLISSVSQGSSSFEEVKDAILNEIEKTRNHISDSFQEHEKRVADEEHRTKFLESPWFSEIHSREETIAESAQNIPREEVIGNEGHSHEGFHIRRTAFEDSAYGTASHSQLSGVKVASPTEFDAAERPIDDSGTEYSEISVTNLKIHAYMECLADDLYTCASKIRPDPQRIWTLSESLPELLQDFALRIGQEVPLRDGREVMFYVYKYRR